MIDSSLLALAVSKLPDPIAFSSSGEGEVVAIPVAAIAGGFLDLIFRLYKAPSGLAWSFEGVFHFGEKV